MPAVKCDICNRCFPNRRGLRLHTYHIHRVADVASASSTVSVTSAVVGGDLNSVRPGSFVSGNACELCEQIFANSDALHMHKIRTHCPVVDTGTTVAGISVKTIGACDCNSTKSTVEANVSSEAIPLCDLKTRTCRRSVRLRSNACSATMSNGDVLPPVAETSRRPMRSCAGKRSVSFDTIYDRRTSTRKAVNGAVDLPSGLNNTVHDAADTIHVDEFTAELNRLHERYLQADVEQHDDISDQLHAKLQQYVERLAAKLKSIATLRVSEEVAELVEDVTEIGNENRESQFSVEQQSRLDNLRAECNCLQCPVRWTWAADDKSSRGKFNKERMELCVRKELVWKVIDCPECKSTGLLVGVKQCEWTMCPTCMKNSRKQDKARTRLNEDWQKVRPQDKKFPKRVESGCDEYLPDLSVAERSCVALVQPVVTVRKNHYASNKKLRQECITIEHDPTDTWCKILPRTDLRNRFMVIERRIRDNNVRYYAADAGRVGPWLRYLFANHPQFIRKKSNGELQLSEEALLSLDGNTELAEVDHLPECDEEAERLMELGAVKIANDDGLELASHQTPFTENHVFFVLDRMYITQKEMIRIRKDGKIEIVEDRGERKVIYSASATEAFPYLYPCGEASPLDVDDYKHARQCLQMQTMFAHEKEIDGQIKRVWRYQEDDAHLMFQYARLQERMIRAKMSWYIGQHPEVAHLAPEAVCQAFEHGCNEEGLLESHLPELTMILSKLPNSRERFYCERLGIETIALSLGCANLFLTINMEPRAWPDVRKLLYYLENGKSMAEDHPFDKDTEAFTRQLNKYATFVQIYLYRKTKILLDTFLGEICGIEREKAYGKSDWSLKDKTENGWYWGRVEYTETRGVCHYHILGKLPHTIETPILARMIQNGRVVLKELRCGNIRSGMEEQAWELIFMGLLASRYSVLLADSMSTCSFYTERMDSDSHDPKKVILLEPLRDKFVENYCRGNVTRETHPIMRRFDDPDCDENEYVEMASVAAVSCLHQCYLNNCGSDGKGQGQCRFSMPHPLLKYTVPCVVQIDSERVEVRVLQRRTCERVSSCNWLLLRYLRSNHDVQILLDGAHSLRYVAKYATKSVLHQELMREVVQRVHENHSDLIPLNTKNTISSLVLADCSHRAFVSKCELAYKVAQLPEIMRTFPEVAVVGIYPRALLIESRVDKDVIEYSDRTQYSAYAERLNDCTVLRDWSMDEMNAMCYLEFVECVNHKWKEDVEETPSTIAAGSKSKFKKRVKGRGHWVLNKRNKRAYVRCSVVLNTEPAKDYEPLDDESGTTQTSFYDMPAHKRKQLLRAYYELVMYVPWHGSPDESFLHANVLSFLQSADFNPETGNRWSRLRLEEFHKVYMELYDNGEIAPEGSRWHRDNMMSASMHQLNIHNARVRNERATNNGVFDALYEPSDELANAGISQVGFENESFESDAYPSSLKFLPVDTLMAVLQQEKPKLNEIAVAFPTQSSYQQLEERVMVDKTKRFMAHPPPPSVPYEKLTKIQKIIVDLVVEKKKPIVYIEGRAGCDKTAVALEICSRLKRTVQAGACTGRAASNFNGPTIHSMFGWSHNEDSAANLEKNENKLQKLRLFYHDVTTFVIDEVNALSASALALLHEQMTVIFNKEGLKGVDGNALPFGGKQMVFLGDPAQLRPVMGAAIYDASCVDATGERKRGCATKVLRAMKGQELYRQYLVTNCVLLKRGQRNVGMLGAICDRLRDGTQTEQDLDRLTYLKRRFPDAVADCGVHYDNEACHYHNWEQLWKDCIQSGKRLYLCKASYHIAANNVDVVRVLASLESKYYSYAPDVLAVSIGSVVRLIENVNVSAGLINSAIGTVVKVVYDNADVKDLIKGDAHPPPYVIVVDFPCFRGFPDNTVEINKRYFPFPQRPTWVPIFRKKFTLESKHLKQLPSKINHKQAVSLCYRMQMPLDLASHVTCHRAQGQTMSGLVSVDLGLAGPDCKLSCDVGPVAYVGLTRSTSLSNLLVSNIFPSVWMQLGKSKTDQHRKTVEADLLNGARKFALYNGFSAILEEEWDWPAEHSDADDEREWQQILNTQSLPERAYSSPTVDNDCDFEVKSDDGHTFVLFTHAVETERHIALDQGIHNFAVAVVDKHCDALPHVLEAENYDLQLTSRFKAGDVVVRLAERTNLLSWMQVEGHSPPPTKVDRVIVHVEQMSVKNKYSKVFGKDLASLLQSRADPSSCMVKFSNPNLFCATGPAFQLGKRIVDELHLRPVATSRKSNECMSDSEEEGTAPDCTFSRPKRDQYRERKRMSSGVFRYIMERGNLQMEDELLVTVDDTLASNWQNRFVDADLANKKLKCDDVGDAVLHCLRDIVCCSAANYRQLIPAMSNLRNNRTIVLSVFPDFTYWIACQSTWNSYEILNFGCYPSALSDSSAKPSFRSNAVAERIVNNLAPELSTALHSMEQTDMYSKTAIIQVIVKQQTKFQQRQLDSRQEAGALTKLTRSAMTRICDEVIGFDSRLVNRKTKAEGYLYSRTDNTTSREFRVILSTGKHTNSITCCLSFFKAHLKQYLAERRQSLSEHEKIIFYNALRLEAQKLSDCRLEMLRLSHTARTKFASLDAAYCRAFHTRNYADLILVALNKNENLIKAIAANYRQRPDPMICMAPSRKRHKIQTAQESSLELSTDEMLSVMASAHVVVPASVMPVLYWSWPTLASACTVTSGSTFLVTFSSQLLASIYDIHIRYQVPALDDIQQTDVLETFEYVWNMCLYDSVLPRTLRSFDLFYIDIAYVVLVKELLILQT